MAPARPMRTQDARSRIVDLDKYDAQQAIEDLGIHRHVALPLSGPAASTTAPIPEANPRKYGKAAARKANRAGDQISRWGNLYQPTLEEQERDDGLGGGQLHRLGNCYQPSARWIGLKPDHHTVHDALKKAGAGRGRGVTTGGRPRARSLSPAPRGKGRGVAQGPPAAAPPAANFDIGRRPPPRSVQPARRAEPAITTRQVKPRVPGKFHEDSAVLLSEVRARMRPVNLADVQHWNTSDGRLVSNRAEDAEFFRRGFLPMPNAANDSTKPGETAQTRKVSNVPTQATLKKPTAQTDMQTSAPKSTLGDHAAATMTGRAVSGLATIKEEVKAVETALMTVGEPAVVTEVSGPSEGIPPFMDKSLNTLHKSKWAPSGLVTTPVIKMLPVGRGRPSASHDVPARNTKPTWAPVDPMVLDSLGPSNFTEEGAKSLPSLAVEATSLPVEEEMWSQPAISSQPDVPSPSELNAGVGRSTWTISGDRIDSRSSSRVRNNEPPTEKRQTSRSPLAETLKEVRTFPGIGLVNSKWAPKKWNETSTETARTSSKVEPKTSGNLPTVTDNDFNDKPATSEMDIYSSNDDWVAPPPAINPFEASNSLLHLDDPAIGTSAGRRIVNVTLGKRELHPAGARSPSISSKEYEQKIEDLNNEISSLRVADQEKTKEFRLYHEQVTKLEQDLQQAYHARTVANKDLKDIKENISRLTEELKRMQELRSAALAAEERARAQERKRQEAERRAQEQAADDARRAAELKKLQEEKDRLQAEAVAQEAQRQEREKLRLQQEREERRIREEKEAEERRIREEKAAEELRIQEEKKAEERRIQQEKEANDLRIRQEKEAEERRIQAEEANKPTAAEDYAAYLAKLEQKPWRSLTAAERRILNAALDASAAAEAPIATPVTQQATEQAPQQAQPIEPVASSVNYDAEFQRLNDIAHSEEAGEIGADYIVTVNLPEIFGKPTVTVNLPLSSHNPQCAIRDTIRGAIGADHYATLSGLDSFRKWHKDVLNRFYKRKIQVDMDL